MRKLLTIAMVLCMVGVAAASDFGNQAPIKANPVVPENVPNPELQGGDTIFSATVIPSVPYSDSGTTAGYVNDYDAVCPYSGSTSPDVCYSFTPAAAVAVDIDLCNSSYDTKVYVYDSGLSLIACNDDFYFGSPCYVYSSKVENVAMAAGQTYYVIVDGYGGAFGAYVMNITVNVPCIVDCPAGGYAEGEPTLQDGYVDHWNGGCNTPGFPFQNLSGDNTGALTLCGVSGWYNSPGGAAYRDTDWFILTVGPEGAIDITLDAEYATYMFELSPQDCNAVGVAQSATGGPCLEAYMTIPGAAGSTVWFWAGPTVFSPPSGAGNEYNYVASFTGLDHGVATEATNWSTMKALFE